MLSTFAKKSVDSVLSAFDKAITDLEQVNQESLAQAARAEQDRTEAEARRVAAVQEAQRAAVVADRLKSLVSADCIGQTLEPARAL